MNMKRCHDCGKTKSIDNFHKNKHHKDGLASACKPCAKKYCKGYYKKNKNKLDEYNKQWREKNTDKEYRRRQKLKHKYGITLEQHRQMYVEQDGCCVICEKSIPYSEIDTDHDHQTGKVRGLLCRKCNLDVRVIENKSCVR